jgi:hypothetical protein
VSISVFHVEFSPSLLHTQPPVISSISLLLLSRVTRNYWSFSLCNDPIFYALHSLRSRAFLSTGYLSSFSAVRSYDLQSYKTVVKRTCYIEQLFNVYELLCSSAQPMKVWCAGLLSGYWCRNLGLPQCMLCINALRASCWFVYSLCKNIAMEYSKRRKKGKVVPLHAMEALRKRGGIAPTLS